MDSSESVAMLSLASGPSNLSYASIRGPPWLSEPMRTSLTGRRIAKRGCRVHGVHVLPRGYELAYVPSDAVVTVVTSTTGVDGVDPGNSLKIDKKLDISYSYTFTKSAIAVAQLIYASVTLYRARGDQIDQYGYAAFGLTVTPYIIMSFLNLVGQIATADYPTLYVVRSDTLEEAARHGGHFDGMVGRLIESSKEKWVVETVKKPQSSSKQTCSLT